MNMRGINGYQASAEAIQVTNQITARAEGASLFAGLQVQKPAAKSSFTLG